MVTRTDSTQFGGEFRSNTIPAKNKGDFLTGSQRLMLIKATGKEDDPTLERDRRVWLGLKKSPDSVIDNLQE